VTKCSHQDRRSRIISTEPISHDASMDIASAKTITDMYFGRRGFSSVGFAMSVARLAKSSSDQRLSTVAAEKSQPSGVLQLIRVANADAMLRAIEAVHLRADDEFRSGFRPPLTSLQFVVPDAVKKGGFLALPLLQQTGRSRRPSRAFAHEDPHFKTTSGCSVAPRGDPRDPRRVLVASCAGHAQSDERRQDRHHRDIRS
jgi:hypothetical protein